MEKERLPGTLRELIGETYPGEELRIVLGSDMTRDGAYGEEWLVVTDHRLLVVAETGDDAECLFGAELAKIEDVNAVNLVGSGGVEVKTDGRLRRVIIYSDARNTDFHQVVEGIKAMIAGEGLDEKHVTRERRTCERCLRPIPQEMTNCPYCSDRGRTFVRLLQFSRPYARKLVLIFLLTVLGTSFGLIIPYMSKLFIDFVFVPHPETGEYAFGHWHLWLVLGLIVAYAAQCFFSGLQERVSGIVGFRTVYDVRAATYERVQRLSLSFFDRYQTGSIMARLNQDTGELQRLLVDFVPMSLECAFTIVGVGVLLFVLSWRLTLFVLVPIAATIVFLRLVIPTLRAYFHRFFHRRSRVSALVNDTVSGIRVVKAFGQESVEIGKFDSRSGTYRDAGIDLVRKWSIFHPLVHFFIMCGSAIVWLVGGRLIFRGSSPGGMSIGDVVAYSGYLMMFYRPVFMLTRMAQMITNALSAAERIFDIADTQPEIEDAPDAVSMPALRGEIEFRDVTFGYTRFKPVVTDMSLRIAENEVIGLVGKSGAGKSTIVNLICRLYDVEEGQVLVDDTDLRKIKGADLRKHIGVVLQETFLFNGTIFENISYARPDATRDEIIDAATAANAHEFIIRKPDGYDTIVGERGSRLSGGEKQRIAIVRALLKDPRILILDEATSSVDVETEKKIQEAVEVLTRSRTTIAIAHRLSTLRNCDRLLVIDEGRVVEAGTHSELMAAKGEFYRLAKTQEQLSAIVAIEG